VFLAAGDSNSPALRLQTGFVLTFLLSHWGEEKRNTAFGNGICKPMLRITCQTT